MTTEILTLEQEARLAEQETRQAEEQALAVLTGAKAVLVTSDEEYREAGKHFATIKGMLKTLEARRVAITGPINASLKLINDGFKRPKETLEAALGYYERPMAAYQREQERLRKEAEAAALREKQRLEAEAREIARQEQERIRKAQEEATAAQEEAENAEDPMTALLAQEAAADALAAQQEATARAEQAIRDAARVEVPVEFAPKATAAGTSVRKNWKFRIVDVSLIPREFLIPDEALIGAHARNMKENASIPGVEFYEDLKIGGR